MIILEVLTEHGELRFSRLAERVAGISQTDLGLSLGEAFCGVWICAATHLQHVEQSRQRFDKLARKAAG